MASRLTYSSLPLEIKRIGWESLGPGVLKSLFAYTNTYHLMIKVSDGIFIGFALYHFVTRKDSSGKKVVTGVIDCVCVKPTYRKEGFGTLLTYGVLRKMSNYGADRVEIALKVPRIVDRDGEPGFPFQGSPKVLDALGFENIDIKDNAFERASVKYGYDCIFCGNRPDTCSSVLFALTARSPS